MLKRQKGNDSVKLTKKKRDSLLRHSRAHVHNQTTGSPSSATPLQASSPQFSLPGESPRVDISPLRDPVRRDDPDAVPQNDSLSSSIYSRPSTASATGSWGTQVEQPSQILTNGSLALNTSVLQQGLGPSPDQYVGPAYPGIPANIFNTPTDMELMDIGLNAHEPAWLLGSDFDLNALDFSISTAFAEWPHTNHGGVSNHQETYDVTNTIDRFKGHTPLSDLVPAVQYNWYTTLTRDVVCYDSPDQLRGQDHIDEAYRESLKNKLLPCPSSTALPSADFLVSINFSLRSVINFSR